MRWIDMTFRRLRSLLRAGVVERELDEELRYHLDRQIEEYLAAGLTYQAARAAALKELGSLEGTKEHCRDVYRVALLDEMRQDLHFGSRVFLRRPGFTLCVVIVLSLGISSATAIFSVVNGVLLTPLPYIEPERILRLFGVWEHGSREGVSPSDFADYRQQSTMFESMAAAGNATPLLNLKGVGEPE